MTSERTVFSVWAVTHHHFLHLQFHLHLHLQWRLHHRLKARLAASWQVCSTQCLNCNALSLSSSSSSSSMKTSSKVPAASWQVYSTQCLSCTPPYARPKVHRCVAQRRQTEEKAWHEDGAGKCDLSLQNCGTLHCIAHCIVLHIALYWFPKVCSKKTNWKWGHLEVGADNDSYAFSSKLWQFSQKCHIPTDYLSFLSLSQFVFVFDNAKN